MAKKKNSEVAENEELQNELDVTSGKKKRSKSDKVDMDDVFSDIAQECGGTVMTDFETAPYFFDTGNLALNYTCAGKCIGGGIPGRITENIGGEASGKTLIGSNCLYSCQRMGGWAVLLDCENSSSGDFMQRVSHVNLKRIVRLTPSSLERAFRSIHVTVAKIRDRERALNLDQKPILVVFDSLTVPPCERELKENDLPMDFTAAEWKKIVGRKEQPGERAKVINAEMRKLQSMIAKENVAVYIINQIRDRVGVLYGSPEITPGGKSVQFYSSLRIRMAAKKKIEHSKLKLYSGSNIQARNLKNRYIQPFLVADDIKLFFKDGIDPLSGLLQVLIGAERIKGKGTYEVAKEFLPEGQESYKFKASMEENRINSQVLLDCPRLVDANSKEEVEDYLSIWGAGMKASESGEYEEKNIVSDENGDFFEEYESKEEE